MADVVERLPFPISKRLASTVSEIIARDGREIHYTLAGVPFRLATSSDIPLTMETAQMQKNQQDNEPDAGEQTLSGWWLRSQASWHEGAGALYMEPRLDSTSLRVQDTAQFRESSNVDVWTPGALSLLKDTVPVASSIAKDVAVIPGQSLFTCVVGQAGAVRRYTNLDAGTATTDLYLNGGVQFTHVVATDLYWFAAGNDGKVYSGPVGSVTTTPKVWTLNLAGSGPTRIAWAKHRLWAVNGNRIYWIDYGVPGVTNPLYTHPSDSWQYTDIADVPGGVLFSGYGDGSSQLQLVTLNTDGNAPTMSGATSVAVLPSDEKALRVSSLTGSLVCILTNWGVRVAATTSSGEFQFGPLFLERDTELSSTVKPALTASGRFWWASFGDEPKMWRIDSSTEIDDGVFAYASDMECASNPASISVKGGRVVTALSSGAVAYTHATRLAALGYIQTGRIRFRTDEFKTFVYCDVTAEPLNGSVSLDLLNSADTETRVITWSLQGVALTTAQVPAEYGPQRFLSAKVTLQRNADNTDLGPVIQGVRVKALPAAKPQRIYTLPLECFDHETWSTGQLEGYDGFARDRYLQVRSAEDAGGVVQLVNYGFPDPVGELVRIEEMKFVQLTQPDARQLDGGLGGILIVTLRTLT